MRSQAGRSKNVLERRPHFDLLRPLLGLVDVDVANDLVPRAAGTAGSWAESGGHAGGQVVEVGPAGPQEVEAPFKVGRRQDVCLDLRRYVSEAPEVGRARSGDAFDDLHIARPRERFARPGPFGDAGVSRDVGQQLLDRILIRLAPAIEAGPVHGARHDPALLADFENHAQLVGHTSTCASAAPTGSSTTTSVRPGRRYA